MRLLLALVALTQCGEPLAQEYAATTKQQTADKPTLKIPSKSLDFVNKMREDLRRNNDDYALLEGQNQLEYPSLQAHPAPRQPSRKRLPPARRLPPSERAGLPRQDFDTRRGKGDMNQDVVIQGHVNQGAVNQGEVNQGHVNQGKVNQGHVNQGKVNQGHVNQGKVNQGHVNQGHVNQGAVNQGQMNQEAMIQGDANQTNQLATDFRSFTHDRHLKSLRVSKIKKMLHRDKDKLMRMREAEPEGPDTIAPTSAPTPAPPPPPPRRMHTPLPPVPQRDVPLPEKMERQGPPRRLDRNPPPLPDQIDMAHARNPLLTRIRLKGRLCQRNLMNAEGPTYDRDGKEVMPEHNPRYARNRLFRQTRAPELVLPKCCNCCKKSVLGCQ